MGGVERRRIDAQGVRAGLAHDAANAEIEQIVHIDIRRAVRIGQHRLARIHRQIGPVNHGARQIALDAHDVRHNLGHRHSVPAMRVQYRAGGGDLHLVGFFVRQDAIR